MPHFSYEPTKTATLDEAMAALQRLPEDTQMALAEELVALAEDYQPPGLTDEQRDIVARRLAEPRSHMPRADFLALLRRYNPAL